MRTVANAKLRQLQRRAERNATGLWSTLLDDRARRAEGQIPQHVPRDEIGGALPDVTVLSWLLVTVGSFITGYFGGIALATAVLG